MTSPYPFPVTLKPLVLCSSSFLISVMYFNVKSRFIKVYLTTTSCAHRESSGPSCIPALISFAIANIGPSSRIFNFIEKVEPETAEKISPCGIYELLCGLLWVAARTRLRGDSLYSWTRGGRKVRCHQSSSPAPTID